MKKNISINISGIIFHIEEDGYDSLRKYLDSVNRYFASFDDSSEILSDIESRIAEIFLSKLNEGKQVITAEDVNSLITTMGSVSDFKAAEEQESTQGESNQEYAKQKTHSASSKKLLRDQNRKILGGVCAGLGHYFNIDPVWPRLLLALLVFGSYGSVLIVYIILWILLPASELAEEASMKKMFRDSDKKVIGGVASGVAAFFGADLTLVRALFIVTGIFGGLGILLYIILWIALPEARTITEKMKMQGEPVTLSNIESSVKKSMNEKENAEESVLAKIILFPFRVIAALINGISRILGPLLKMIVDVLRVAIGLVFTLTGVLMIITLIFTFCILVGVFNAPDWSILSAWSSISPNLPADAIRNSFSTWTVFFTFLVAFIPAVFLLLIGNSIIARRLIFNQTVGWSLFVLLFVSILIVSFSLPQIIMGFKEEGEYKTEQIFNINGKTPVFQMNEVGLDDYDVTSLTLKGYDGKEIKLVERFQSQGPTRKIAGENAQMVQYNVVQNDSVLIFDSNISFKKDAQFRAQQLDVDIFIPYGQSFVLDAKLWRIIDTDILYGSYRYRYSLNEETHTWQMTDKGIQCVSCPKVESDASLSEQDQFGLKDFRSVELKGLFTVRIEKGEKYSVAMTGPDAQKKRYDVYVNGETLVIEYDDHRKVFWKRKYMADELKITITMPELHELDVTGAGRVKFMGFETEEDVSIQLTGAITADGEMNANNLNIKLTGASVLELAGKGKFMDADILGASSLRAYGYEVEHGIVEAHGASSAKVNVTEKLEIKRGIASRVSHHGNPEIIKR